MLLKKLKRLNPLQNSLRQRQRPTKLQMLKRPPPRRKPYQRPKKLLRPLQTRSLPNNLKPRTANLKNHSKKALKKPLRLKRIKKLKNQPRLSLKLNPRRRPLRPLRSLRSTRRSIRSIRTKRKNTRRSTRRSTRSIRIKTENTSAKIRRSPKSDESPVSFPFT